MPLARIITTSTKYSDGLADDLRSRGFQVLTSVPGENVSGSADLEITLNECLPEEATATAADTGVTTDMRVFVTPRAFAGNIRSIEMFVLTSKRPTASESLEIKTPVDLLLGTIPISTEKVLQFTPTAEALVPEAAKADVDCRREGSGDQIDEVNVGEVEDPCAGSEEAAQPAFDSAEETRTTVESTHSDSFRVIEEPVESRPTEAPAWPNVAEMKLVPAELTPMLVNSAALSPPTAIRPSDKVPAASVPARPVRPEWRQYLGRTAVIAAVLVLSAIWLVKHSSVSQASRYGEATTTVNPVSPPSADRAIPASAEAPVSSPKSLETAPSSPSLTMQEPEEKQVAVPPASRAHAPRALTKQRKHNADSDYVAKDTTVYFNSKPTGLQGNQKSQARP